MKLGQIVLMHYGSLVIVLEVNEPHPKSLYEDRGCQLLEYYLPRECWIAILLLGQLMLTDLKFIEQSLLPHLMPFNGINPHSIVVLDNCSIHHVDHLVNLIESMGVLVLFLPPYSPDMMPIESAFSKAKSFLKANEIAFGAYDDPTDIVLAAFASITPEDCLGWIQNCGY